MALFELVVYLLDGAKDRARRHNNRCNTQNVLDIGGWNRMLLQLNFVAVEAHAAAIDRRNRRAPQFEVDLLNARIGQHIHTQTRTTLIMKADTLVRVPINWNQLIGKTSSHSKC